MPQQLAPKFNNKTIDMRAPAIEGPVNESAYMYHVIRWQWEVAVLKKYDHQVLAKLAYTYVRAVQGSLWLRVLHS